jgi:hypothetical protein
MPSIRVALYLAAAQLGALPGSIARAETPAYRLAQHIGGLHTNLDVPVLGGADFNGDGHVDLLLPQLRWNSAVPNPTRLLLGQGDGVFIGKTLPFWADDFNDEHWPSFAAADFNRDGRIDLVYSDTPGSLRKLLGLGGAQFRNLEVLTAPVLPNARMVRVVAGDFDGNGVADVAAIDSYGSNNGQLPSSVLLAMSDAAGYFTPPTRAPMVSNAWRLVAADVTADGRADLIGANAAGEIGVASFAASSAGFVLKPLLRAEPVNAASPLYGDNPGDIAVGDLDGDGKPDLVVHYTIAAGGSAITHLRVLLNRDTASVFAVDQALELGTCAAYFTGVRIGDFNADGIADIVASCEGGGAPFVILFGRSAPGCHCSPHFDPPVVPSRPNSTAAEGLARGDYNGDGRADLAVIGSDSLDIYLYDPAYDRLFANGFEAAADAFLPASDGTP